MWMFPSRDIHLVRNAQPNTIELRVFDLLPPRPGTWTDVSMLGPTAESNGTIVAFNVVPGQGTPPTLPTLNGITSTPQTVLVTPNSTGQWIVDVEYTNSRNIVEHGLMRVSTHDDITALFAGDRLISMWAGENDRQLTVYARFSDGAFEDVTAHPYLKYDVDPPTLATVDRKEGRIIASTPGIGTITVRTWDDRFAFQVGLAVQPALEMPGAVPATSEQLRKRTTKHRATLYVLAEGYQDRERFFEHAHKAVDEWLRTQPYARVADQFDAVAVFLSSPQTNITIASPVRSANVTDRTRSMWELDKSAFTGANTVPVERMLTRDTIFGLMAGTRLSTPLIPMSNAAATAPFADLFVPEEARTVQPDPRRLAPFAINPRERYASFIQRFLIGAGHAYGPEDRIVMLVDDRLHLGTSFKVLGLDLMRLSPPRPMTALGIRSELEFPVVGVTAGAPLLDRDPDPSHDAGRNSFNASATGSVVAHELAHTYMLGDEYENDRRALYDLHPESIKDIESNENLHVDRVLRLDAARKLERLPSTDPTITSTNVDVTRIKWNVHRIKKGTPVASYVSDPPNSSTATNFILTVAPDQVRRWKPGERAFLRNRVTNRTDPLHAGLRRFNTITTQIVATDPQQNTIRVLVTLGTSFSALLGKTPLLYIPQHRGTDELTLIDPVVLAFIASRGPFAKPTQCGVASPNDNDDVNCPEIPGFKRPSVHAEAIGLYEGGNDISCGVYRPTGRCKMRKRDSTELVPDVPEVRVVNPRTGLLEPRRHWATSIVNFCFVCQYMLIDLLDPSQHEALDKKYPKDC